MHPSKPVQRCVFGVIMLIIVLGWLPVYGAKAKAKPKNTSAVTAKTKPDTSTALQNNAIPAALEKARPDTIQTGQSNKTSGVPLATSSNMEGDKQLQEEILSGKSREDLYREVFNITPPKQIRELEATLVINEAVTGMVDVVFTEDRLDFSFPSAPVIKILSEITTTELVKLIKTKIDTNGRITQRVLEGLNLKTVFDSRLYRVVITVPTILLLKQVHNLTGGVTENPYSVESTKPNAVSAYLNIAANQQLQYRQKVSNNLSRSDSMFIASMNKKVRQPIYSNFDGALNIKDVVLEGSAGFRENGEPAFRRSNVRIVYDQPQKALRFSAGDITYSTIGYQSFVNIGGAGISKDFSLQPHILTYQMNEYEFYLTDPAEVEVWVNDAMVSRMYLDAGTHDIRGYPFISGNNKVKILTKDFAGRKEAFEFSSLYETSLLAKGLFRYSCNVGFPSSNTDRGYIYNVDKPFASLVYQGGVSKTLTLAAYTQAFSTQGILGCELLRATPLGPVALNTTGSYISNIGPDFAARIGFTFRSSVFQNKSKKIQVKAENIPTPIICNTQAEYLGSKFMNSIEDSASYNPYALKLSTDVIIPLAGQFSIGIGGKYYVGQDTTGNMTSYSLSFQKSWKNSLRTTATIQSSSEMNNVDYSIFFTAQWSFRAGPNDFSVSELVRRHKPKNLEVLEGQSYATEPQWDFNTSFLWSYDNTDMVPEKFSASVGAQLGPDNNDYRGLAGYTGNQGSIELTQSMDDPSYARGTYLQHQTHLGLKTSLVYVDKTVCFSRPIYGGFAVAKGIKNLSKSKIIVNPTDQGYEAITNRFGPAVLPFHSSYQLKHLNLAPLNPPVGSVDEKMNFTLFPGYKNGFLLSIGAEKTVLVFGRLLDTDGTPISYQAITIVSVDNKKAEPVKTFTNGIGRFQFLGIGSGTYQVVPPKSMGKEPATFDIPGENKGFFRMGDLTLGTTLGAKEREVAAAMKPAAVPPPGKGIFVVGDLLYIVDKTPVAYQELVVSLVDDPNEPPIGTFTNQRGEFQFVCIKPGIYKVVPADSAKYGVTRFIIPKEKKGFVHVGTLILKGKSNVKPETPLLADSTKAKPEQAAPQTIEGQAIYVLGLLMNSKGTTLAFTPISIISIDDPQALPINSFTNKDGGFQIICINPGKYKITANTEAGLNVNFEIPAGTKGMFDIGKKTFGK